VEQATKATKPDSANQKGKNEEAKKRVVTMEPSVRSFAGASSARRDRSEPVMITDALADVRVK
jgi:hypothetical protein